MKSEIHLFIIWENARDKQQQILDDIKNNFKIIRIFEMQWNKENFSRNLSRFYGTNLPKGSGKEEHCGNGKFLLIIVKDESPKYEERATSKGSQTVNVNLFDKKTQYRELTGGGHKIHATNNEKETNHDITLLLGKNIEDFLEENKEYEENISELNIDLFGNEQWESVTDMFYALNNCTNYAILRNYESLPEEIYENDHNDIDVICESLEDAVYILNAESVFEEEYRVHYKTKVENKIAYFDLRHIGDNYYEERMERDILANREFCSKGFYILNKKDYFYTLLYHALLQKTEFKSDYKEKLAKMKIKDITNNESTEEYAKILKKWIEKNKYAIVEPIDKSVLFNPENVRLVIDQQIDYQEEKEKIIDEIKENILNWYPFEKDSTILYLNSENLKENQKYDYVCVIETISNITFKELIKIAKEKCKDDGTILVAVDNKFGMKFWTSEFANKNIISNSGKAISKSKIEGILDEEALKNRKFYYVLPDIKATNVIFTNEYLPTQENISRNFTYADEEFRTFNQTEAFQQIIDENPKLFPFFTNSYFIEIKKDGNIESDIKFVSYTNIRKAKYRIKTIMSSDSVKKTNATPLAIEHIKQMKKNIDIMNECNLNTLDSYNEDGIESKLTNEKSYDQILIKLLKENKKEQFINEISKYKNFLLERLVQVDCNESAFEKYNIKISKAQKEKLHFVKNGLWDLIFQNAFLIKDELYFYDQEWYEENIPIEFIIYRAIIYFGEAHKYISKDELLNILGLNEYEEIFGKLDGALQNEIRDDDIWELHCREKTGQTLYDLYNNLIMEFSRYKELYNEQKKQELQKKIEELQKEKEELCNKNNQLEKYQEELLNSTSWKITKPVRWLGKYK